METQEQDLSKAQPVELPDTIQVGPVVAPGHTLATVTDKIANVVLRRKIGLGWLFGLFVAFGVMQLLVISAGWLFIKGVGVWGINIPIGWGFAIVNFVWWIGIGHAGTLISAILLLLESIVAQFDQSFRRSDDVVRGSLRRACSRFSIPGVRGWPTG